MERFKGKEKDTGELVYDYLEAGITSIEEARELIEKLARQGVMPVVTVPEKYSSALASGLRPHASWSMAEVLAATFAREPYLPEGENGKRIICEVSVEPEQINPRFTGKEKIFRGVVGIQGAVSPDRIKIRARE